MPVSSVTANRAGDIKGVRLAGQDVKVDLALTELEQERGLSGRRELAVGEGMLFVFPAPGTYYFWMKGVKFSIDMIWLAEDMRVIYIAKNVPPDSYPRLFGPKENSKYVLEVAAGFSEKNNLRAGDRAELQY